MQSDMYLQNDSNVNACLLDATNAFNFSNFVKLFTNLIEPDIPICYDVIYWLHTTY